MSETTTDRLAEIEGQAADYTPPEGWRWLQEGEVIQAGDEHVSKVDNVRSQRVPIGNVVPQYVRYIRRIESEPEPFITPDDVAAEPEPQPVQMREGRWRTRGGDIRNIIPTPAEDERAVKYSWHDVNHDQTWLPNGRYHTGHTESPLDLWEYLGPIESEPEHTITPDDVAAEALAGVNDSAVVANPFQAIRELRRQLETTEAALLEQQQQNERLVTQGSQQRMEIAELKRELGESVTLVVQQQNRIQDLLEMNEATEPEAGAAEGQIAELQAQVAFLKNRELTLGTRLQDEKAVTAKRLQQVEELRSEVSHVQRLLGDEKRRFAELETLASDLRAVNAATEKAMNSAARDKADLQHRLDTVAAEWAVQAETIKGLESLLEAVKAELAQVSKDRYTLQIELDAREQVPQAVSDRFEEGWDAGTARAVETIAEWTEVFRTCGSQGLSYHVMQNLPHIMRMLTGLADED